MRQKNTDIFLLLFFITFSLMNFDYAGDEAADRLNRVVEEYMNLKNSLVHARTDLSGPWAERLETTLATTPNDIFDEDEVPDWQAFQGVMMDAVGDMIENDDIDIHREALGQLSAELKELLNTFGNPADELYVFSCSDYGDGDVIWLSDSDEVANPYHGPENLDCGEIVGQL